MNWREQGLLCHRLVDTSFDLLLFLLYLGKEPSELLLSLLHGIVSLQ
jgi:hypothetical protein